MSLYVFVQFVVLVIYVWSNIEALSLDPKKCPKIVRRALENPWLYYTYWSLFAQHVFLAHSLLHEFFKKCRAGAESKILKASESIKNFYFVNIVFPTTTSVLLTFWFFYLIDRELVYPKIIDDYLPSYQNYIGHLLVVVPVILEFLTKEIQLAPPKLAFLTLIVEISYTILFVHRYVVYGEWIYPLFYVYDWPLKILIISSISIIKTACLATLYWCQGNRKASKKQKGF